MACKKSLVDKKKLVELLESDSDLSVKQIAGEFGVSTSTIYSAIYSSDDIRKKWDDRRRTMSQNIEHSMYQCATGYFKEIPKHYKLKKVEYEAGKKVKEWEEIVEVKEMVYFKPDVTAAMFLLKNWANYSQDPAALEIRKKELELHEKKLESEVW